MPDIGTRIPFMKYFQKYSNVNILLVAYRGFSYSEGTPTEQGLQQDAIVINLRSEPYILGCD